MLIGDQAAANTYPYIRSQQPLASVEHEASTCRISEDQLFYLQSRGIAFEEAVSDDGEWLLSRRVQPTADGVRRRSG
jgi:hypothetical protein